jgi:hypothetical protein
MGREVDGVDGGGTIIEGIRLKEQVNIRQGVQIRRTFVAAQDGVGQPGVNPTVGYGDAGHLYALRFAPENSYDLVKSNCLNYNKLKLP